QYPISQNPNSTNLAANGVLTFFTYLREARRAKELDVEEFLSDINPESVEAFMEDDVYSLPKGPLMSNDKFRRLALKFPEFLDQNGIASMERSAVAAAEK